MASGGGDYYNQGQGDQYLYGFKDAPQRIVYDGKRMRKAIVRKVVDYNHLIIRMIQNRTFQRNGIQDNFALQPHWHYMNVISAPSEYLAKPISSVCTKFAHTSINKVRCPIFCVTWTPEGRRLITGSSSGEFTLWNGTAFNFETILQAHDTSVRSMVWTHNGTWMVTGDHGGVIKYWEPNMNNVKVFDGHKETIRDLSFCCTDMKFASCSDDVTLKIWDFITCKEEKSLTGHGWDVKCLDWHPHNSLIISGSKDHLIKLWDSKSGQNIATLHGHKNSVLRVKWNTNGNWVLSASRDQLIKLFDIRTLKEISTFKGHKKEVTTIKWHPFHEELFVSGDYDGCLIYWFVEKDTPTLEIPNAHEAIVWDLDWHPLGHILVSGSNDHTTKFWVRSRLGEHKDLKDQGSAETESKKERIVEQSMSEVDGPIVPGHVIDTSIPGIGGALDFRPPHPSGFHRQSVESSSFSSQQHHTREPPDFSPNSQMPVHNSQPIVGSQVYDQNYLPGYAPREMNRPSDNGKISQYSQDPRFTG